MMAWPSSTSHPLHSRSRPSYRGTDDDVSHLYLRGQVRASQDTKLRQGTRDADVGHGFDCRIASSNLDGRPFGHQVVAAGLVILAVGRQVVAADSRSTGRTDLRRIGRGVVSRRGFHCYLLLGCWDKEVGGRHLAPAATAADSRYRRRRIGTLRASVAVTNERFRLG
jgi:hypothetical protein